MSKTIQPACLPSTSQNYSVGEITYVLGWGTTQGMRFQFFYSLVYKLDLADHVPLSGTGYDTALKQGKIPIYPLDQCEVSYPRKVWHKMICAGYQQGGTDSCKVHTHRGLHTFYKKVPFQ